MGVNFPPRRLRHRLDVWRDRRRYPWRYPYPETRRFHRLTSHGFRRRFFVVRSIKDEGRTEHLIFAECASYPAALDVAALGGERVFSEGQMLDHPERRRALTAWDKGDDPQRNPRPTGALSRSTSDTLWMEAPNG